MLLSRRLTRFVLVSIAVPLTLRGVRALREGIERRGGPTRVTAGLERVEMLAGRLRGRSPRRRSA